MANHRKTTKTGRPPKRGFAVLDRDKALKSAAVAINTLRGLSTFATSAAAWRRGLDYAMEQVETQLNDILRYSSSKRLPDDLHDGKQPVTPDIGEARKDAAAAVKVLRKTLKDARTDLSVDEYQCNGLDHALDQLETELNKLLPPPGAPPKAKLPFDDDEDTGPVETDLDSASEIAQAGGKRGL